MSGSELSGWLTTAYDTGLSRATRLSCALAAIDLLRTERPEMAQVLKRLRELAADVVWFDWSENDSDAVATISALRNYLLGERGERGEDRP